MCMSGGKSLDMPRTPYRASEGKHSQQPIMPYHLTLTSSSVHHSSHQRTALFYRITISFKDHYRRKNDVKQ